MSARIYAIGLTCKSTSKYLSGAAPVLLTLQTEQKTLHMEAQTATEL